MTNVATTDISSAAQVEFASVSAQSGRAMSNDLFGELMAYHAGLGSQDSYYAPAPDPQALAAATSTTVSTTASTTATTTSTTSTSVHETTSKKSTRSDSDVDAMRDVKVTAEDYAAMKPQLEKHGMSEQDLQDLEDKVNSAQGITWGGFVQYVADKTETSGTMEFTTGQKQKLLSFFQRMGVNAADSEKLVGQMSQGNLDGVLKTLEKQFQGLDKSSLSADDLAQMQAFMNQLRQLKVAGDAQQFGLAKTMGDAMKNAMDKARQQALGTDSETAAQVAERLAKGQDKATVHTDMAHADRLESGQTTAEQAKNAAANADKLLKTLDMGDQTKAVMNEVTEKMADGLKKGMTDQPSDHFLKQEQQSGDKSGQDSWSEFMAKLRQDPSDLGKGLGKTDGTDLLGKDALGEGLAQIRQNMNDTLQKADATNVMRQVQDAVVKNLGQGRKQLTLQLDPAELGKLSITLTANKGEVQATIRADNHETAKLISENLDSIRQTLEDQGVKVSKLEVQTQLSQHQGNQWLGQDGHNQAQEQENQNRMMNRWRVLRASGSESASMEAVAAAARQLSGETGLHVIA